MWAAAGHLKLVLLAGVLMPAFEAVSEPSTNVEDAAAAALAQVCNAGDTVAGDSCHMAMLQQKASKERTPALTASFLSRDPVSMTSTDRATGKSSSRHQSQYQTGSTAALDEAGYRSVLELRSKTQTETLVRRLVQDLGLKVMHEDNFRGYVGSLSETGVDLNTIRGNLEGEANQPCGWVTKSHKPYLDGITGSTAALTEDGYRQVAELRSTFEMFRFARRVISNEGYYLVDKAALDGMLGFYTCDKGIQSYGNMLNEVRRVVGSDNAWLSLQPPANLDDFGKQLERQGEKVTAMHSSFISTSGTHPSVHKRRAHDKLEERIKSWSTKGPGTTAMLTAAGYEQAAGVKSNTEMSIFVLRTIRQMGLQVVDENTFAGLVPFYSGEVTTQSFAKLKTEIHNIQGLHCSWIVPADDSRSEANSGNLTAITEEGYAAVSKLRSPSDTHDFLRRVFGDMHMEVIDKNGLNGFIPFHDCERGANSLATLRKEVIDAAKAQVWIKAMDAASILQHEHDSLKSNDNSSSAGAGEAGKHGDKASVADIASLTREAVNLNFTKALERQTEGVSKTTDSKVVAETVESSKFNGTDITKESDSITEEAGQEAASGEARLSTADVAEEKATRGKETGSTEKGATENNRSENSDYSKASKGESGKVEQNTSGESGKVAEVASNNDERGDDGHYDLDAGEDDLGDDADDHVVDDDGKVSKVESAKGETQEVRSNSDKDGDDELDEYRDDRVGDDDGKVSKVESAKGEKKEVVSSSDDNEFDGDDDLDDDADDHVVDEDGKVSKTKSAKAARKKVVSNQHSDTTKSEDESLLSSWEKAQSRGKELGVSLGQKQALAKSETSSKEQNKIKFKGALHVAH